MKRFIIDFILIYLIIHIAISYKQQSEIMPNMQVNEVKETNIASLLASECSEGICYFTIKCMDLFQATYSLLSYSNS